MKKITYVLILWSLCVFQCTKPAVEVLKLNGNKTLICNIDRLKDTVRMPLSKFVDTCVIIKLDDSTPEAFVKNIAAVDISENFIGIRSRGIPNLPYKLFTREGKFLRNIGMIGKGPNEYLVLSSSQIDEKSNKIFLTPSPFTEKIFVFDLQGNYFPQVELRFKMRKCKVFINNDTLTGFSLPFEGDTAVVLRQTLDGNFVNFISPDPSMITRGYNEEVFSFHNTPAYEFFLTTSKVLMHYDSHTNALIPKFSIISEKYKKDLNIFVCYEWPNHYYGWISKKGYFIVNKQTLKANYVKLYNDFCADIDANFNGTKGYFVNWRSGLEIKNNIEKNNSKINYDMTGEITLNTGQKIAEDDFLLFIGKLK